MFCTSCGNQLKDQQKFCPKCGAKTKFAGGSQPSQQTQQNEPAPANKDADRAAEEERQKELKRQQEEQERKNREEQRKLEEQRQEEEKQRQAELEAQKKAEEEKRREEEQRQKEIQAEKKRAEEERLRLEKERNEPLPSDLLLEVRTILLEKGKLQQQDVSTIKAKATEAGVSSERLRHQLKQELSRFGQREDATDEGPDSKKNHNAKTSGNRKALVWVLMIVFLLLLGGGAFIFRSNLVDAFDDWGFETAALRQTIGVPLQTDTENTATDSVSTDVPILEEKGQSVDSSRTDVSDNKRKSNNKANDQLDEQAPPNNLNEPVKKAEAATDDRVKETVNEPRPRPTRTSPSPVTLRSAEVMPEYPGDNAALQRFISRNLNYPIKARSEGISGVVYVSYVVDERGNVTEVNVLKGVHPLLDQAAMDVVRNINGYAPGYQDGKPVRVSKTLPIRFRLD